MKEMWGSFRGRDKFGADLGITSELGIISRSGSFRGLYRISHKMGNKSIFLPLQDRAKTRKNEFTILS